MTRLCSAFWAMVPSKTLECDIGIRIGIKQAKCKHFSIEVPYSDRGQVFLPYFLVV